MIRLSIWVLLAVVSIFCPVQAFAIESVRYVYRVDERAPDEIFSTGFRPWGTSSDILSHIAGDTVYGQGEGRSASGFVSTTESEDVALRIAYANSRAPRAAFADAGRPPEDVWVYRIRADSNFYAADPVLRGALDEISGSDPVRHRLLYRLANEVETREWISDRAISTEQIQSAVRLRFPARGEQPVRVSGSEVSNAGYVERNTQSNQATYPFSLSAMTGQFRYLAGDVLRRIPLAFFACGISRGGPRNNSIASDGKCPVVPPSSAFDNAGVEYLMTKPLR